MLPSIRGSCLALRIAFMHHLSPPCCFSLYLVPYTLYLVLFLWFLQGFFPSRWPCAICRRPPPSAARLRFYGAWWGSLSSRAREMVGRATFDCKTQWFCHLFAPKTSWSLLGALGPPGCLLGAAWVPPGCLLGASWVPPGCFLGASWEPLLGACACWVPPGCLHLMIPLP